MTLPMRPYETTIVKFTSNNFALEKVMPVLKIALLVVCLKFLGKLTKWIKLLFIKRRIFLQRRVFLQRNELKVHKKGITSKVATTKSKIAEQIKKGEKKIEIHAKKAGKEIDGFIDLEKNREKLKSLIDNIKEWGKKALKTIEKLSKCHLAMGNLAYNLQSVAAVITTLVTTGGAGLAPLLVLALCNWRDFINAFKFFKAMVDPENDKTQRILQFGKFMGQLLLIFGHTFPHFK